MPATPTSPSGTAPSARPARLVAAVAVVAAEGLALLTYAAVALASSLTSASEGAGLARGVAAYGAVLGGLVLLVAASLWRRRSWSLGAALALQLLGLLLAVTLLQEGYLEYGLPLALLAGAGAACLLHRGTRAALGRA